jgi:hypothetical protein
MIYSQLTIINSNDFNLLLQHQHFKIINFCNNPTKRSTVLKYSVNNYIDLVNRRILLVNEKKLSHPGATFLISSLFQLFSTTECKKISQTLLSEPFNLHNFASTNKLNGATQELFNQEDEYIQAGCVA